MEYRVEHDSMGESSRPGGCGAHGATKPLQPQRNTHRRQKMRDDARRASSNTLKRILKKGRARFARCIPEKMTEEKLAQ